MTELQGESERAIAEWWEATTPTFWQDGQCKHYLDDKQMPEGLTPHRLAWIERNVALMQTVAELAYEAQRRYLALWLETPAKVGATHEDTVNRELAREYAKRGHHPRVDWATRFTGPNAGGSLDYVRQNRTNQFDSMRNALSSMKPSTLTDAWVPEVLVRVGGTADILETRSPLTGVLRSKLFREWMARFGLQNPFEPLYDLHKLGITVVETYALDSRPELRYEDTPLVTFYLPTLGEWSDGR